MSKSIPSYNLSVDNLYLIGVNHETAPLHIRELFVFDNATLHEKAKDIKDAFLLNEVMIVSTCNRTEILAVSKNDVSGDLINYLSNYTKLNTQEIKKYIYIKNAYNAVRHVFEVACGINSQVIGETQVLSQLKEAYRITVVYNLSGAILNRLMRKTFSVAKLVRSQTDIQKGHLSVASLAADVADKIFKVENKKVLIIGSGDMARLSARYFSAKGAIIELIANRRVETVDFAKLHNARVINLNDINEYIGDLDILISCIYTPNTIGKLFKINKKLLIIDLSVPSSIDAILKNEPNITLLNIDDLKVMQSENTKSKIKEVEVAKSVIDEHLKDFIRDNEQLDYNKTINSLRQYADRIRKIELNRFKKKYDIDNNLEEALDKLTKSILNKTLHEPTSRIRQFINEPEGDLYVELLRRLFNVSIDKSQVNCFFSQNPENEND